MALKQDPSENTRPGSMFYIHHDAATKDYHITSDFAKTLPHKSSERDIFGTQQTALNVLRMMPKPEDHSELPKMDPDKFKQFMSVSAALHDSASDKWQDFILPIARDFAKNFPMRLIASTDKSWGGRQARDFVEGFSSWTKKLGQDIDEFEIDFKGSVDALLGEGWKDRACTPLEEINLLDEGAGPGEDEIPRLVLHAACRAAVLRRQHQHEEAKAEVSAVRKACQSFISGRIDADELHDTCTSRHNKHSTQKTGHISLELDTAMTRLEALASVLGCLPDTFLNSPGPLSYARHIKAWLQTAEGSRPDFRTHLTLHGAKIMSDNTITAAPASGPKTSRLGTRARRRAALKALQHADTPQEAESPQQKPINDDHSPRQRDQGTMTMSDEHQCRDPAQSAMEKELAETKQTNADLLQQLAEVRNETNALRLRMHDTIPEVRGLTEVSKCLDRQLNHMEARINSGAAYDDRDTDVSDIEERGFRQHTKWGLPHEQPLAYSAHSLLSGRTTTEAAQSSDTFKDHSAPYPAPPPYEPEDSATRQDSMRFQPEVELSKPQRRESDLEGIVFLRRVTDGLRWLPCKSVDAKALAAAISTNPELYSKGDRFSMTQDSLVPNGEQAPPKTTGLGSASTFPMTASRDVSPLTLYDVLPDSDDTLDKADLTSFGNQSEGTDKQVEEIEDAAGWTTVSGGSAKKRKQKKGQGQKLRQ